MSVEPKQLTAGSNFRRVSKSQPTNPFGLLLKNKKVKEENLEFRNDCKEWKNMSKEEKKYTISAITKRKLLQIEICLDQQLFSANKLK